MRDRQDQSDLLAAQLATGGAAVAFVIAAIGGWFVNYGLTMAFGVGAVICFVAANKFHALANLHFRLPFIEEETRQRTYWDVFKLTTYVSVTVAILLSIVLGGGFYIFDLRERLAIAKTGRHLTPAQRSAIAHVLSSHQPGQLIYVNSAGSCDECEEYAQDFREAIEQAPNWKAGGGSNIFGNASVRGIWLDSPTPKTPSPFSQILAEALNAAGIKFNWGDVGPNGYEDIFVARQPR
jgi:hypothetical protein